MSESLSPQDSQLILGRFMYEIAQGHQVESYEDYRTYVHGGGIPRALGSLIRQHPETSHSSIDNEVFGSHINLSFRHGHITGYVNPYNKVVTASRATDRMWGVLSRYRESVSFSIDGSKPDRATVNGTILGGFVPNLMRYGNYEPHKAGPNENGVQELNSFLFVASRVVSYLTAATVSNWPET